MSTIVASSLRAPLVVKDGYCFHKCGKKYGPCDYCGKENYCCKKSEPGCEDEPDLKNLADAGSRCVGWRGEPISNISRRSTLPTVIIGRSKNIEFEE